MFTDAELERYSRQLALPSIRQPGQTKLKLAHVAIIGLGGLGTTAAMMLAASGVGRLKLIDGDRVELSNLQRQVLYRETDIGRKKSAAAHGHLTRLNGHVQLQAEANHLHDGNIQRLLNNVDLVLDCTDQAATRALISQHCQTRGLDLIQAAVCQLHGEVLQLPLSQANSACYHCLHGDNAASDDACARKGALAPMQAIIGGLQAQLALQTLLQGAPAAATVFRYDAESLQLRSFHLPPRHGCGCATATPPPARSMTA